MSSSLQRKNLAAAGPEKFTVEFIQKQVEEFNIGKRHLANMMGEDPENFTQEDVDVSALRCCIQATDASTVPTNVLHVHTLSSSYETSLKST